jgi:hypothetical protein
MLGAQAVMPIVLRVLLPIVNLSPLELIEDLADTDGVGKQQSKIVSDV